ncbi:MAG: hypothetical protein PWP23_188 [Candidatus Sumerlaeota bacterium]|nr:hypothetical protein [Candidatus Sumerlaeota bacterium]
MTAEEKDPVQAINQQLDARRLIEAIGFRTDKMVVLGGTLKTPCMIHKDDRFSTLLVQPKKNTCKCMVASCEASREITLVELVGLHLGLQGLDAAFEAARLCGLEVDEGMRGRATGEHLDNARQALEEGDLAAARESIGRAAELDPESVSVALLSGRLAEEGGNAAEAAGHFTAAARLARKKDDRSEAERILREEALRADPDNEQALLELADAVEDAAQQQECLLKVIELREKRDQPALNVPLFERLKEAIEADYRLRLRHARALEAARQTKAALTEYEKAAEIAGDEDPELSIEIHETLVRLHPGDIARREALAALYEKAGRSVDAGSLLAAIGTELAAQGKFAEAETYFRRILESDAGSVSAHEGLASLFARQGMRREEATERLAIARSLLESGLEDQAIEEAAKARELEPDNPAHHLFVADALLATGDVAMASPEFLEALRCFLIRKEEDEALALIARLLELSPADESLRNLIADCYLQADRVQDAISTWHDAAAAWLDRKDPEQALEFCRRGLQADPSHAPLQVLRLRAFLALGKTAEALHELDAMAEALPEDASIELDSKVLLPLVEERPKDVPARLLYADLCHREGKKSEALEAYRVVVKRTEDDNPAIFLRAANRALELDPTDASIRMKLAEALEKKGDVLAAADHYEQAATLAEEAGDTINAEISYRKVAELRDDNEKPRQALVALFTRTGQNVKLREEVLGLAEWYQEKDRIDDCLAELRKLHELMPSDMAIAGRISELLIGRGDTAAALDLWIKLALRLQEAKDHRRAAESLQRALVLEPGRLDLREKRALMLEAAGQTANALEEFHTCVEGQLLAKQPTRALELVERCERIAEWEFLRNLYRLLANHEHKQRAIEGVRAFLDMRTNDAEQTLRASICEFGLELDPSDTELRTRLAELCEALGRPADAITHGLLIAEARIELEAFPAAERLLRHLASLDANDKRARLLLVELHNRNGQPSKGGTELLKLAKEALETEDLDEARTYLERASQLVPDNIDIGFAHAEVLEQLGMTEEAGREYARVARIIANGSDPLEAKPIYDRLLQLAPDDIGIGSEYLDFLLAIGARESAAQQALALARRSFERNDAAKGRELCARAAQLVPLSVDHQVAIAELLASRSQSEEAIETIHQAATAQLQKPDPDCALELLEWGIARFSGSIVLLRELVRAQLAAAKDRDAVQTLARIARRQTEEDQEAEAEATWKELLDIDSDNREARQALASLIAHDESRKPDAVKYLRELLALDDGDHTARELIEVLRQLLELDPEAEDIRQRLATMLCDEGEISAARDEFALLAKSAIARKDNKTAIDYYEKALELDPESPVLLREQIALALAEERSDLVTACSLRLASVFEKAGAFADAISVCEGIVQADPTNIEARLLLASYFVRDGKKARALGVYIDAAEAVADTGDTSKAREVLARLEKLQPLGPKAHEASGRVYFLLGNETEAFTHLIQSAKLYRADGESANALRVTDIIMASATADVEVLELRAILFEDLGKTTQAIQELEKALPRVEAFPREHTRILEALVRLDPSRTANRTQLATAREKLGDTREAAIDYANLGESLASDSPHEAIAALRKAIELDPASFRPHELLAELLATQGDKQNAAEEFLWIASHAGDGGDIAAAQSALEKATALLPESTDIALARARLLETAGDQQGAAAAYADAAQRYRDAGDPGEAAATMRLAASLVPEDLDMRTRVAHELYGAGRIDEALDEFTAVVRTQLSRGMIEESSNLLRGIYETESTNEKFRSRIAQLFVENDIPEAAAQEYTAIAELHAGAGRFDQAKHWCRKTLEIKPRDLEAREILATACKGLGEIAEACEALLEVGETLREAEAFEKAQEVYEALSAMEPNVPGHAQALANIYQRLGKTREAGEELARLAQIHRQQGDSEMAARVLEQLIETVPGDMIARTALDDALSDTRTPRRRIPNLVELARLLRERGSHDEAIERLRTAVELDPADPQIRTALIDALVAAEQNEDALAQNQQLVQILLDLGAFREAGDALAKVERIGKGNADFHLAQAQVHKARNARGMALIEIEQALKLYRENKNDTRRADVLRMAVELDPQNLEMRRELVEALTATEAISKAVEQQLLLADAYMERGLADLAEKEFRQVIKLDSDCDRAWRSLFEARLGYGEEKDLQQEYLDYSDILARRGDTNEALHYISMVIRLNPWSIPAREKYIEAYLRLGTEIDLCDDYLVLADLYIAADRVDDGIKLFSKVMSLDPENKKARDRLSETQARRKGQRVAPPRIDAPPTERPHETKFPKPAAGAKSPERRPDGTGTGTPRGHAATAASFLADEMESMDEEEERQALEQVIQNYRDILGINPQNASVRVKLADLLEQLGSQDEAIEELVTASEHFFQKGEINPCIAVCERILKARPADQRSRVRLKQAVNKRDAMKALESAIWFEDEDGDSPNLTPKS